MTVKRVSVLVAAVIAALLGLSVPASAATAAPVNAQDRAFLVGAHQANLAEITAAKIALQKATKPVTKQLAIRWIRDHSKLDASLRPVARKLGVALPSVPNPAQRALAAKYRATSGPAFDKLWVSTQMTAHHQAMALGDSELKRGSNPAVKHLAAASAPVVATHAQLLDKAEKIVNGSGCHHSAHAA
jgi:putative membrane protein